MKKKKLSIAKVKTLFIHATHKVKLRTWVAFWILLILIPIVVVLLYKPSSSKAAWFNSNWRYRVAISIPSHSSNENNVYVTVPTFDATDTNKFQSDCGDLRFTKENGQLLKYYVVDCDATADIHVQFDTLIAGASTYYMYYGNASAPDGFESSDFSTAATGLGSQTAGSEEITPAPVGFWLFDEGQGAVAHDGTQSSNNIELNANIPSLTHTIDITNKEFIPSSINFGPTDSTLYAVGILAYDPTYYYDYLESELPETYLEIVSQYNQGGYAESTGQGTAVDCIGFGFDSPPKCKVAYYDTTNTALRFISCDGDFDASCYSPTITVIDGAVGCELSGCNTSRSAGDNVAIDCSNGLDDCKIAYYNTTDTALMFADCDNETCSSGTITIIDGHTGCALTNCVTTARVAGSYPSIDCSSGSTDCKITYQNTTDTALMFADCGDATCSTGTVTIVDGHTGCGLTNCVTTTRQSGGPTSMDCSPGATDCKIAYYNQTDTALMFADCADATCSTGTVTIVDGHTGCGLTNCVTTTRDSGSIATSIDCTPGATDCKIAYYNTTDTALMFADCGDATCSTGTVTIVDGHTGCGLTNCVTTTRTAGQYPSLDCTGGGAACSISYSNNTDSALMFADCDTATCSTGTVSIVDGNTGCGLTNCVTARNAGTFTALDCSSGFCKITYYNTTNTALMFADCDWATSYCSAGTITMIDGGGAYDVVGSNTAMDCSQGTEDCKTAYIDSTNTAIRFADCNDSTCSNPTITVIDGDVNCVLTNCNTARLISSNISINCSNGADDCKIAYYNNTDSALMLADCDNETCSTGTVTIVDGHTGCGLTNCITTTRSAGAVNAIDCSSGTSDCKITYYNSTDSALMFADCADATCSTGTVTIVDGHTGCGLTNCVTTARSAGLYLSVDCSQGTVDCKIAYYNTTNSALMFADCDDATCSTGNVTLLEGNTGCVITGCSTTASTGEYPSLDCSQGAIDCKISYHNFTGEDLYFVDCNDATCSTGNATLLDGNTGCVLTGCSTSSARGTYNSIDCSQGTSDCKISYYNSTNQDLLFADCDTATCSSGNVTLLDGNTGCVLTGCRTSVQTGQFTSIDCSQGTTDCKVASYYNQGADLYFADCNTVTCSSGTINSSDIGEFLTHVRLFATDDTPIGNIISINSSTDAVTRASLPDLASDTYTVRAMAARAGYAPKIQAARLIVKQTGPLLATSHRIELASAQNNITNTSYATLDNPRIYHFDLDKFSSTDSLLVLFEAILKSETADTTYAQLIECTSETDCSTGTPVSGSELSHDFIDWSHEGEFITLDTNKNYAVQVKVDSGTGAILNAKISIFQETSEDTIEKTQTITPLLSIPTSDNNTTYTSLPRLTSFDPSDYIGNTYFEANLKADSGDPGVQLYNQTDTQVITDSELTTSSSSDFSRLRSLALTLPTSEKTLDVQINNSSGQTTTVTSASFIQDIDGTNTVSWSKNISECFTNHCLYYDGISSFGTILNISTVSNSSILDFDTGLADGFTFGAWVKVNSDGENDVGRIISKGTNTYMRTTNEGADGKADLEASLDLATSDATVSITNGLTLNTWHYVSMAYTDDGDDEISVYIDGRLRSTSSNGNGAPATDENDLSVGGIFGAHFHGYIDTVRVYAYQRDNDEMKVDANNGSVVSAPNTNNIGEGLIAHWKFDELSWSDDCSTTSVIDSSGNGHHARSCPNGDGIATPVTGKYGNAAGFDNSNDYLEVPSTIDLANKSFSLAAWVYRDGDADDSKIFTQGDVNTNEGLQFGYGTDNTIGFGFWGNDLGSPGFQNETNTWTHLVGTYNAETNERKIYENGILIAQDIASADYQGSGNLTIGEFWNGFPFGSASFYGKIDDARVYGRAITAVEVSQLYSLPADPIAHWKLDENTGTTTYDSSGNNNDSSTFTGTPTWTAGKYGSGLLFDGDDVVRIPETSLTDLGALNDSYTVSAWIKTTHDFSDEGTIVAKSDAGAGNFSPFYLFINSSDRVCFEIAESIFTPDGCSSTAINDGDWHYVTFIRNTDTDILRLYIDGQQAASLTDTVTEAINNNDDISIGNSGTSYTQNDFVGSIDNVMIYRGVHTPEQIIQDMNASHPIGGSPIGSQALYWKFDEGQGTTANAAVSETPNGTLTSIASPATSTSGWTHSGKHNKAITFDGSDDKVVLATANDANVDFYATEPFALSAWIYMTTAPDSANEDLIIGKWDDTNDQRAYRLYIDNDDNDSTAHIAAYVFDESAEESMPIATANDSIEPNTWYHVTFTYDGTNTVNSMNIYINGKLSATSPLDTFFVGLDDVTSDFTVGDYDADDTEANNTGFTGMIDGVQVYNLELTAPQVQIVYNANAAISVSSGSNEADTIIDGAGDPPVLHWNLDQNTGTAATDISGNNKTGTLTNSPSWAPGKNGSSLYFDSSTTDNQHVILADDNDLDFIASDSFTIETWFLRGPAPDTPINDYIVSKYNGAGYKIWLDNESFTTVNCGVDDDSSFGPDDQTISNGYFDDSKWHHVACVKVGTTGLYLYVDGVLVSSDTSISATGTLANSDPLYYGINDNGTGSDFANGSLDDLKIYNYARTAAQVAYDYNRGGPIGWWKFDECQGTTAYDASGKGNNGTITIGGSGDISAIGTCNTSSTAWGDGATGKFNSGLRLDGFDDYVDLGDQPEFKIQGDLTLSIWAYPTSLPSGWTELIARGPGNLQDREYTLGGTTTNTWRGCVYLSTTGYCAESPTTMIEDQWSMITFTRSGTTLGLYVNGKLVDTETGPSTVNDIDESVSIGRLGDDDFEYFPGIVDDARIYNYALSPEQIRTLMNENSSLRFGPSEGSP